MMALAESEALEVEGEPEETRPQPVYELPSGRPVGWWSPREVETAGEGWHASPMEDNEVGYRWRLLGGDGNEEFVEDVIMASEVRSPAVRFPGWAATAVGAGRPAGLLVEWLATTAAKADIPLWVPNLHHDALQLLLRLPGTFWVDGPAAPKPD
jgi:hypothetical protein